MGRDLTVYTWYPVGPWQIGGANGLLREPQIWEAGGMDLVLAVSLEGCVSLGMPHAPPPQILSFVLCKGG